MKPAPMSDDQIINAMHEDGCERIENFYVVGPVQKAAVFSFAQAIIAARDKQWEELLGEPVAWQGKGMRGQWDSAGPIKPPSHTLHHYRPLYALKETK